MEYSIGIIGMLFFHRFPMIYPCASAPLTLRKVSADLNVRSSTIQRPKTLGTIPASILLRCGGMFNCSYWDITGTEKSIQKSSPICDKFNGEK